MTNLYTADLHLTSNPRDGYRWRVFPWLSKVVRKHHVDSLYILGDLTEAKDRHAATLVNRLVFELRKLSKLVPVTVLQGNHDYIDDEQPFFGFLGKLGARVRYVSKPTYANGKVWLPSTRSEEPLAETIRGLLAGAGVGHEDVTHVYFHHPLAGARLASGTSYDKGYTLPTEDHWVAVGGDIHVPQKLGGNVWYTGSPHPVDFGDDYVPRVLLERDGKITSLRRTNAPQKLILTAEGEVPDVSEVAKGAQVCVRITLQPNDLHRWAELKRETVAVCKGAGLDLLRLELLGAKTTLPDEEASSGPGNASNDPLQVLNRFADKLGADESTLAYGRALLEGAQDVT